MFRVEVNYYNIKIYPKAWQVIFMLLLLLPWIYYFVRKICFPCGIFIRICFYFDIQKCLLNWNWTSTAQIYDQCDVVMSIRYQTTRQNRGLVRNFYRNISILRGVRTPLSPSMALADTSPYLILFQAELYFLKFTKDVQKNLTKFSHKTNV